MTLIYHFYEEPKMFYEFEVPFEKSKLANTIMENYVMEHEQVDRETAKDLLDNLSFYDKVFEAVKEELMAAYEEMALDEMNGEDY